MRVLGAPVQTDVEHDLEYLAIVRVAWAADHIKTSMWQGPGRVREKLRVLHMGVFLVVSWASGTRHWSGVELRGLQTVQARMARRLVGS